MSYSEFFLWEIDQWINHHAELQWPVTTFRVSIFWPPLPSPKFSKKLTFELRFSDRARLEERVERHDALLEQRGRGGRFLNACADRQRVRRG